MHLQNTSRCNARNFALLIVAFNLLVWPTPATPRAERPSISSSTPKTFGESTDLELPDSLMIIRGEPKSSVILGGGIETGGVSLQAIGLPHLSISSSDDLITVQWADAYTNYVLETTSLVGSTSLWQKVSLIPERADQFLRVRFAAAERHTFYRLVRTEPVLGKVVSAVKIQIPPEELALLKVGAGALIDEFGLTFVEDGFTLARMPLKGRLVRLGSLKAFTDESGLFTFDYLPAGVHEGQVFRQITDREPAVSFPVSMLVPKGQSPREITITSVHNGPFGMDGPEPERIAGMRPQATIDSPVGVCLTCDRSNARPCCLDYDGWGADGCKTRDDTLKRVRNYIGSTCFKWVQLDVCNNERNSHDLPHRENIYCFQNHRFRNCQSLEPNALSVIPSDVTIRPGERVTFKIYNNTPANETFLSTLRHDARGTLLGPVERTSEEAWIRHYDSTKHLETIDLTYQPGPGSPSGTDTFLAEAYGARVSFSVTVATPPPVLIESINAIFLGPGFGNVDETVCLRANSAAIDVPATATLNWELSTGDKTTGPTICFKVKEEGDFTGTVTVTEPDAVAQIFRFSYRTVWINRLPMVVTSPCGESFALNSFPFTLQEFEYRGFLPLFAVLTCFEP